MRRTALMSLSAITPILVLASVAYASTDATTAPKSLLPGDAAPGLKLAEVVKGKNASSFEAGKTYVVEFWATWCGPCKTSIPHLTKLQQKYGDKVQIIGVSIWERGDNIPERVKKFVDDMGAQMDYTVARDADDKFMDLNWMKPAKRNGIPSSFIVHDRKVAWIGHPMEIDKPLDEVVNGKWNVEKARAAYDVELKEAAQEEAFFEELGAIRKQHASGQRDQARAALKELAKKYPKFQGTINSNSLQLALTEGEESAFAAIDEAAANGSAALLAQLAYSQANGKTPNEKLVLYMLNRATGAEQAETNALLGYYAGLAYRKLGMETKAKDQFKKSLHILNTSETYKDAGWNDLRKALENLIK